MLYNIWLTVINDVIYYMSLDSAKNFNQKAKTICDWQPPLVAIWRPSSKMVVQWASEDLDGHCNRRRAHARSCKRMIKIDKAKALTWQQDQTAFLPVDGIQAFSLVSRNTNTQMISNVMRAKDVRKSKSAKVNLRQEAKFVQIRFAQRTRRFLRLPQVFSSDRWWTDEHACTNREHGGPQMIKPCHANLTWATKGHDSISKNKKTTKVFQSTCKHMFRSKLYKSEHFRIARKRSSTPV